MRQPRRLCLTPFTPAEVGQQIKIVAPLQQGRQVGAGVFVSPDALGRAALGGRAERRGVELQQVEDETRVDCIGPPAAQAIELAVEEVAQKDALPSQVLIAVAIEAGPGRVGLASLLPHHAQQDLECRCHERVAVVQQFVGDEPRQFVGDLELVPRLEPRRYHRPRDLLARRGGQAPRSPYRLDDPSAVERLQEHLGPGQEGLREPPFDHGQPLHPEPEDELAARPVVRPDEDLREGPDELFELSRVIGFGARKRLLDLVEDDDQRPALRRLRLAPGVGEVLGRTGRHERLAKGSQQALLLVPAQVERSESSSLEPGLQTRGEQR